MTRKQIAANNPDKTSPEVPRRQYNLRILQSIRRIIRAVDLHSRKLAMQHNITGPQLACLMTIHAHGPLTSVQLAREVYLSPSTIVGILDRLEEKGLVERQRSQRDRRVVDVMISPAGAELVGKAPSPLQETLATALQDLPEIEQVSITLSLEKVVALMEADALDAAPMLETGSLVNVSNKEKKP